MNISTKTRSALRAVVYLGIRYSKDKVSLKEISENEDISKRYLEQIFSVLKKGGVVNSIKGASGGYFLTKDPSEIVVGDIIELMEGSLELVDGKEIENYNVEDMEYTIMNKVWNELNKSIKDVLRNITLQDIINDYLHTRQIMFYI